MNKVVLLMAFCVLLPGKACALCGNVDVRGESVEILHSETSEAEREQSCALLESKCQISREIKSRADISYIKQILSDCDRLPVT